MISESKLSILRCPICKGNLSQDEPYLVCVECNSRYPIINGIIIFLTKNDLADFFGEAWGSELQTDSYGDFASSEDDLEYLKKVFQKAKETVNRSDWPTTAPGVSEKERMDAARSAWPFNPNSGISEEAGKAIVKSREELVKLSRATSAVRILDWPTGPGSCLKCLVNHVAPETLVIGLDVNFGVLAKTKSYFDEYGLSDNMLFVVADARNMPFKDCVFQAATAWGGTVEIENAKAGFTETYRVLEENGWFGVSGDQYRENSPSMNIAERLGLTSLVTRDKLEAAMELIGFKNLEYEELFEGYDIDLETPDEDRCPLPARGDWYQIIAASGQK